MIRNGPIFFPDLPKYLPRLIELELKDCNPWTGPQLSEIQNLLPKMSSSACLELGNVDYVYRQDLVRALAKGCVLDITEEDEPYNGDLSTEEE